MAIRFGDRHDMSEDAATTKSCSQRLPRPPKRICIPQAALSHLYEEECLPLERVAAAFGCSINTIWKRLREFGIRPRSYAEAAIIARNRGPRQPFQGSIAERAHLIGFCAGDLHVIPPQPQGETITVVTNTTKEEQLVLLRKLFSANGTVSIRGPDSRGVYHFTAYLDLSYSFLLGLDDKIPAWILKDRQAFFAFLAGYTDAEGYIGISNGTARFRLASCDRNILKSIHAVLSRWGIPSTIGIATKAGYRDRRGIEFNRDFWYVDVNRAVAQVALFTTISPYLKHPKRVADLQVALKDARRRSRPRKILIPKAVLERLYYHEKLTQREIAKRLGCSEMTISRRIREYNLPTKAGKGKAQDEHRSTDSR